MLFETTITITAGTLETAPATEILTVSSGVITKMMVRPRPGHAGLAFCTIRYQGHQIAPSTEKMALHGDAFPIDWEEDIDIDQPPFELKIQGWAPNAAYDHSFDIAVAMLDKRPSLAEQVGEAIKGVFTSLLPKRIIIGGGKEGVGTGK